MSNIFESVTEKLGLNKDGVTDQASKLLDSHRDQIPDPIEGKIEEALHGDALGGLLGKIGLGGHHEEAAVKQEEPTEEEAPEEEEPVEDEEEVTEEEEPAEDEEEATEEEEPAEDEEEATEDSEEEEEK